MGGAGRRALMAGKRNRRRPSGVRARGKRNEHRSRVGGRLKLGTELPFGVIGSRLVIEAVHIGLVIAVVDGREVVPEEGRDLTGAWLLRRAGPDHDRTAGGRWRGCRRRG